MTYAIRPKDSTAAVGRLLIALIFMSSGLTKLSHPAETTGFIASAGMRFAAAACLASIAIELGAGGLLAIGFKTRLAASTLASYAVVTAVVFHRAQDDPNQVMHFLKNLAMAGGLMQSVAFGGGHLSVDAWLGIRAASANSP